MPLQLLQPLTNLAELGRLQQAPTDETSTLATPEQIRRVDAFLASSMLSKAFRGLSTMSLTALLFRLFPRL